ncbi:multiple epidermal growth factor-like domains protein 11, partial [Saccostrea cucullata]|uniref:multiple epidermal growth factor-like domains protein 11 n=1 Tax=Saccostrea cuccullata TaxID=36930 RepID=UPI002ED3FC42
HYVFLECKKGFYGRNCSLPCGHCGNKTTCDHVTGFCPSGFCDPGWIHSSDRRCNQACEEGAYGKNCISTCGHCANKATCHPVNGSCPDGNCAPGWKRSKDRKCNEVCDPGWYGSECRKQCGYCRGNKSCHHVTGSCSGLCEPGYLGDKCENSVFSKHLANHRKMIKLMRELLFDKRRRVELKENCASPTAF